MSGHVHRPTSSVPTLPPNADKTPVKTKTIAASACAKMPPPNALTSRHVTNTPAAANSAGTARSSTSEWPNSCVPADISGTSGG